ncbi:hypothetical protein FEE95_05400 [Maribacter algarum]|uniref:Kelch motif-containing protein n=1 Tax=Maribacter algarum (ex Zhang et al. 2020) TaxID=2578118 RepID=A0A5S3PVD4_9FLAO|nr:kelch repeat-containing protein [Maribacter algarum]TMM58868.1 hypothetical protein FEE95_05400 [Maribacter algarum]
MKTILKIGVSVIFFALTACQKSDLGEDQNLPILEKSASFKTSFEVESETLQAQLISENNLNPIHDHASVVFKDKIWVIGGHKNGKASNTILNSSDGVKWNTVKTRSVFYPRRGHSAVVFKNKIWVIGGTPNHNYGKHVNDMSFYNEVWSSSDGIEWEMMHQTWQGGYLQSRMDFGATVFKDEIWVFGGFSDNPTFSKAVQKSSDGINWQNVDANISCHDLIGNQAMVFDNKLWLIGGYTHLAWDDDIVIASTSDGLNWEKYNTGIPKYIQHQLVTDNKKMYLLAGDYVAPNTSGYGTPSNHILYSDDGNNWSKAKASLNFPERARHSSVYFKNKFWIIGGSNNDNSTGLSDVWTLTPIDPYTIDDLTFD